MSSAVLWTYLVFGRVVRRARESIALELERVFVVLREVICEEVVSVCFHGAQHRAVQTRVLDLSRRVSASCHYAYRQEFADVNWPVSWSLGEAEQVVRVRPDLCVREDLELLNGGELGLGGVPQGREV